jgi:hypothetical protein
MNTNKYIHTCLAKKTPKDYRLKPSKSPVESPSCRHGGKITIFFYFIFFLDTDPHLASVVCDLYLFSVSRYELCVCGNMCTCVRVSTNLESPPTMGNFKV